MLFNHSGSLGDVLYALTFMRELAEHNKQDTFDLHLQTNVLSKLREPHPSGKYRMSSKLTQWLLPLLEAQPYINSLTMSDELPERCINLDTFRSIPLFLSAGDERYYYYALVGISLPKDLSRSILNAVPSERTKDKIVFFRSSRYQNPYVNYKGLKSVAKDSIFIGLPEEYEAFCKDAFELDYVPTASALEAAQLIAGAKLVIGNQTSLFAIAEQLKVPRWLESCQLRRRGNYVDWGCPNVLPFGGHNRIMIAGPSEKELELFLEGMPSQK